jgi:CheY-like chemotaxis protein
MERRKTILICDDEPALRELIRASMDDGYEFAEASDGIVAMELAREVEPDLVILDLMLPRLSGLEVLARLNEDERLKDVPVLVITAWNETREDVLAAARALALGTLEAPTRLVRSTRPEVPSVALRFTDGVVGEPTVWVAQPRICLAATQARAQ